MLDVDIEKIIPITEVRDSLNKIIDAVAGSEDLYVVTKNGKPAAIIVGVHHLEKLTGIDHKMIIPEDTDISREETTAEPESKVEAAEAITPVSADTASSTNSDTSKDDAIEPISNPIPEESTNSSDTAETLKVPTVHSVDDGIVATPPVNSTPTVDDGLDDLFAPEAPTPNTTSVPPSPVPTPTTPSTGMSSSPAPAPATSPVFGSVPPAETPVSNQPLSSSSNGALNSPISSTPPTQPPIPPTTNQV